MLFKQKFGQSSVTSLVERVSRFSVVLKNPNKRTKPVMGKIIRLSKIFPSAPVCPSLFIAELSLSAGHTCTSLDGLTPWEYHQRSAEDQTLNRAN